MDFAGTPVEYVGAARAALTAAWILLVGIAALGRHNVALDPEPQVEFRPGCNAQGLPDEGAALRRITAARDQIGRWISWELGIGRIRSGAE